MVHLHVHSYYSLLDGYSSPEDLVVRAKVLGMEALALTDHGNMHGAFKFWSCCRQNQIKPILGQEFYVVPNLEVMRERKDRSKMHIVALALNAEGYRNLVTLSTLAYTRGHYYQPTVDWKLLGSHKEGLVFLGGCYRGPVTQQILDYDEETRQYSLSSKSDKREQAVETAKFLSGFPNFHIEIMPLGIPGDREVVYTLLAVAEMAGVPCVCSTDVHYALPGDAEAQGLLVRATTQGRVEFTSQELWMKSDEEMEKALGEDYELDDATVQGLIENTYRIAERVESYELTGGQSSAQDSQ